ncbi:MAG: flagellar type III secretion system pore protein FliP [Terriglobales bacterium]
MAALVLLATLALGAQATAMPGTPPTPPSSAGLPAAIPGLPLGPLTRGLLPALSPSGLRLPAPPDSATSLSWQIVILLTLLSVLPALLVSVTPFARLLIVFHFLRQALGTDTAPSNQTLIGLALFLTYFVMQPVLATIHKNAITPYESGQISASVAMARGSAPLRKFMLRFTREKDLALFDQMANLPRPAAPRDLPMRVVVPAYIVSELETGFQIGVVLYLPFLVIDMVVAAVTTSVGMMQLPPVVISTPLKILVFVAVDGWHLVVASLLTSLH